jgi:fucose permease
MSTQTQTETIVLQARASTEAIPAEHEIIHHSPPVPKWLYFKVLSAALSFFVAGINDGSLGSLIPYVIRTYNIGTDMVAVVYVLYLYTQNNAKNTHLQNKPVPSSKFENLTN